MQRRLALCNVQGEIASRAGKERVTSPPQGAGEDGPDARAALPVAVLADAVDRLGHRSQVMHSSLRPVVLALHPGTAASLAEAGVTVPPGVHVVQPQSYRTTLALQLHAAAVLTDSGGIQRESAWLGVPCIVLRDRTEWVEAVEHSEGRMVVVGLDLNATTDALDRVADPAEAPGLAEARARSLDLRPAGAADAIVSAFDAVPGRAASA